MKLWKYKIFNVTEKFYYTKDYYNLEELTRALDEYKKYTSQYVYEVHKIEVGTIALTIENDI